MKLKNYLIQFILWVCVQWSVDEAQIMIQLQILHDPLTVKSGFYDEDDDTAVEMQYICIIVTKLV